MKVFACRKQPARESGSTMIESLVAILILSVGMLGIAGIQAASIRYSQGGWARAAVAAGLSDLADRIRANPSSLTTAYVLADDYATQRTALEGSTVVAGKDCEAVSCNAAELANFHLTDWRLSLNRNMPGSASLVSGARDSGYSATVMWFDKSFVKKDGVTLDASTECQGTETGVVARICCPKSAKAPAGVRCTNMTVVP